MAETSNTLDDFPAYSFTIFVYCGCDTRTRMLQEAAVQSEPALTGWGAVVAIMGLWDFPM